MVVTAREGGKTSLLSILSPLPPRPTGNDGIMPMIIPLLSCTSEKLLETISMQPRPPPVMM